jgi:hypothetical protein
MAWDHRPETGDRDQGIATRSRCLPARATTRLGPNAAAARPARASPTPPATAAKGRRVELRKVVDVCHTAHAANEFGPARLDVFRAVAKALVDMDHETLLIAARDVAVEPVAPPRMRFYAQQPDGHAGREARSQRVVRQRLGADYQPLRIGRRDEARRARQNRGPRLALGVQGARKQERQLHEELAMLVGHVIANHARPGFGQPRARAGAFLPRELAFMEGGRRSDGGHAASPTGVLIMGMKPGSASTRASQARSLG